MKKKLIRILVFVCALVMLLPVGVYAAIPYSTYTYSIDGLVLDSPDAYVPLGSGAYNFTSMGLDKDLNTPSDIESDADLLIKERVSSENEYTGQIVAPILADGEIIGGLMLLTRESGTMMTDVDRKVAETTANIVGKQMEQ
jgi:hypothetical protein